MQIRCVSAAIAVVTSERGSSTIFLLVSASFFAEATAIAAETTAYDGRSGGKARTGRSSIRQVTDPIISAAIAVFCALFLSRG